MQILVDKKEVRRICEEKRCGGIRIGFVPTMGALHEGHLSLVKRAVAQCGFVVVSIFINPIQFGPNEDFEKYPRNIDEDLRLLESAGTDLIYMPDKSSMYPSGYATYITVERLTNGLCGQSRPGHFRGVATVVAKLFNTVKPHVAVFGQKDAQQVVVIQRMVKDLDMNIEIDVGPIIRESDGLAMSSRNRYLDPEERHEAAILYKALCEAESMANSGVDNADAIISRVREIITTMPKAHIEYTEIVDRDDLIPVADISGGALLALAVHFGKTRLIDNTVLSSGKG
jgi:pantoate--beta-alanine ligase